MLREEYRLAFDFLHRQRRALLLAAVAFFAAILGSALLLYAAMRVQPALFDQLIAQVGRALESTAIVEENGRLDMVRLFFWNFWAMMQQIGYGVIPFLFLPVIILLLNAVAIGLIAAIWAWQQLPLVGMLALLVPHAVFEIPALLISSIIGLRLCQSMVRRVLLRPEPPLFEMICEMIRVIVLVIVPLLMIAAMIESHVTMRLAEFFLPGLF